MLAFHSALLAHPVETDRTVGPGVEDDSQHHFTVCALPPFYQLLLVMSLSLDVLSQCPAVQCEGFSNKLLFSIV